MPAIDTVFVDFRDLDGLRADCLEAERDGFTAKLAIHPAQVPVINEVFTPSPEAVAHATAVIDAFAAAVRFAIGAESVRYLSTSVVRSAAFGTVRVTMTLLTSSARGSRPSSRG